MNLRDFCEKIYIDLISAKEQIKKFTESKQSNKDMEGRNQMDQQSLIDQLQLKLQAEKLSLEQIKKDKISVEQHNASLKLMIKKL